MTEPCDVIDVPEDHRDQDRADPDDVGQGAARRNDRLVGPPVDVVQLPVDTSQVRDQFAQ